MKKDTLYWKAYWNMFGGIMMFFVFVILPLMMVADVNSGTSGVALFKFGVLWAICFAPLVFVATWGFVAIATANMGENIARAEDLQALARDGRYMMLYGNPVGLLGSFLRWYVWFTFSGSSELNHAASAVGFNPDELSELVPKVENDGK